MVNVVGSAVAAAASALIATGTIGFPWAVGTLSYLLMFLLPTALHSGPATLPGEGIAPRPYAIALFAMACCGCAAAGIGAAAGVGLRRLG